MFVGALLLNGRRKAAEHVSLHVGDGLSNDLHSVFLLCTLGLLCGSKCVCFLQKSFFGVERRIFGQQMTRIATPSAVLEHVVRIDLTLPSIGPLGTHFVVVVAVWLFAVATALGASVFGGHFVVTGSFLRPLGALFV